MQFLFIGGYSLFRADSHEPVSAVKTMRFLGLPATVQDFLGHKKTREKPASQPEQRTELKTQTPRTTEGL